MKRRILHPYNPQSPVTDVDTDVPQKNGQVTTPMIASDDLTKEAFRLRGEKLWGNKKPYDVG